MASQVVIALFYLAVMSALETQYAGMVCATVHLEKEENTAVALSVNAIAMGMVNV